VTQRVRHMNMRAVHLPLDRPLCMRAGVVKLVAEPSEVNCKWWRSR